MAQTLSQTSTQSILRWPSLRGKRYQIQSSSDLSASSWQNTSSLLDGTDAELGHSLSRSTATKLFYRIAISDQDQDLDTLTDWEESKLGTSPTSSDSDSDEMPDAWEIQYSLNPTDATDADADTNGDGITNRQSFRNGTSPTGTVTSSLVNTELVSRGFYIPDEATHQQGTTFAIYYSLSLVEAFRYLPGNYAVFNNGDTYDYAYTYWSKGISYNTGSYWTGWIGDTGTEQDGTKYKYPSLVMPPSNGDFRWWTPLRLVRYTDYTGHVTGIDLGSSLHARSHNQIALRIDTKVNYPITEKITFIRLKDTSGYGVFSDSKLELSIIG